MTQWRSEARGSKAHQTKTVSAFKGFWEGKQRLERRGFPKLCGCFQVGFDSQAGGRGLGF